MQTEERLPSGACLEIQNIWASRSGEYKRKAASGGNGVMKTLRVRLPEAGEWKKRGYHGRKLVGV